MTTNVKVSLIASLENTIINTNNDLFNSLMRIQTTDYTFGEKVIQIETVDYELVKGSRFILIISDNEFDLKLVEDNTIITGVRTFLHNGESKTLLITNKNTDTELNIKYVFLN